MFSNTQLLYYSRGAGFVRSKAAMHYFIRFSTWPEYCCDASGFFCGISVHRFLGITWPFLYKNVPFWKFESSLNQIVVLKFLHLELVKVTYPISRTRLHPSFNFCLIVQLVKTFGRSRLSGTGASPKSTLNQRLWCFPIRQTQYNSMHQDETNFFFHCLYRLCYWSHICRVEHLHLTQFSTWTLKSILLAHKRFDSVYF